MLLELLAQPKEGLTRIVIRMPLRLPAAAVLALERRAWASLLAWLDASTGPSSGMKPKGP